MAKYELVTNSVWANTEIAHEIEGDYDNEYEALEAFGGEKAAEEQAMEDQGPEYIVREVE